MAAAPSGLRLLLPGNDFWVFDDRLVLWNYFTGEGEVAPEGREVTEDPTWSRCVRRPSSRCGSARYRMRSTGPPDRSCLV